MIAINIHCFYYPCRSIKVSRNEVIGSIPIENLASVNIFQPGVSLRNKFN